MKFAQGWALTEKFDPIQERKLGQKWEVGALSQDNQDYTVCINEVLLRITAM